MPHLHGARLALVVLSSALLLGCSGGDPTERGGEDAPATPAVSPFKFGVKPGKSVSISQAAASAPIKETVRLRDVASLVGLEHTYVNAEAGKAIMVEATGGGCGWGDFDQDGNWDLYLNQAGDYSQPADAGQPGDTLFLNVGGQFVDVTEGSRIREFGYSQGVAVGDFDEDGFDDIYVTNYRGNTLWHNLGDGTFEELAASAGVHDSRWSSTAAWGDIDQDGDLDLYVNNYLQYDIANGDCRNEKGQLRICHPRDFQAWPDECFINQGDGRFTAEAKQRGLHGPGNKGLGVAIADFDNDHRVDLYVANDTEPNFMFTNEGAGQFKEQAELLGCATGRNGQKQASMGLAIADLSEDGWLDIYITHYENEPNTFYRSIGDVGFEDATARVGLHFPTNPKLAFGVAAIDLNQNGFFELVIGNGHVQNYPGNPNHKMRSQVLATNESQQWRDITKTVGPFFGVKRVTRGVARCDFDNDGDMDVAMVHQNTPVALLLNESESGNWLKVQFRGIDDNRRGIGCRVVLKYNGKQRMQELIGGGTYASTEQPVLHFGLGDWDGRCDLEIRWPNGKRHELRQVEPNQTLWVVEPQ